MKFVERLFPKESPLYLMTKHAELAKEAVAYLPEVLSKYFNEQDISDIAARVDQIEHDADTTKVEIRRAYAQLRYTYFDKVDALFILHKQDSIIDKADDVIKMLMMNQVKALDHSIIQDIITLSNTVDQSVLNMFEAVSNLRLVAESSFSKKEIDRGREELDMVERTETRSDDESVGLGKIIYGMKEKMNAVDIMFLRDIVRNLAKIADRAESIADKVRMLIRA